MGCVYSFAGTTHLISLTLGFAAPYAFANVIITIMGSVIVNVMQVIVDQ